jgi:hypothetical protein
MAQIELLESVKNRLSELVPADWHVRTAIHSRFLADQIKSEKQVIVTPLRTAWKRTGKGIAVREYDIAAVVVTKGGIDTADFNGISEQLNEWAMMFLTKPNFIDGYPCIAVETIDLNETGFNIDERSFYIDGLQITFWSR